MRGARSGADRDRRRPGRRPPALGEAEQVAHRPARDQRRRDPGRRGSAGRPPTCSSTTARRGSCWPRWASTQRRQAVAPGTHERPDREAVRRGRDHQVRPAVAQVGVDHRAARLAVGEHQGHLGPVGAARPRTRRRAGSGSPPRRSSRRPRPRPRRVAGAARARRACPARSRSASARCVGRGRPGAAGGRTPRSSRRRSTSGSSGSTSRHGGSTPTWTCRSSRRTTCRPGRSRGWLMEPVYPAAAAAAGRSSTELGLAAANATTAPSRSHRTGRAPPY